MDFHPPSADLILEAHDNFSDEARLRFLGHLRSRQIIAPVVQPIPVPVITPLD